MRDAILYCLSTGALYKFKFESNVSKVVGCAKFEAICTAFDVFSDHRVVVCSQANFASFPNHEPVAAGSYSIDVLNAKLEIVYRYCQDIPKPLYEFAHMVRCIPTRGVTNPIDNFSLIIMSAIRNTQNQEHKPSVLSMMVPANPRTFKRSRFFSDFKDIISMFGSQGIRFLNNSLLVYGNNSLFKRIPV